MWPKVEVYMAEKVKNQDGDFSDLAQSSVFDQSSYTCVNRPKTVKGKKIIPCGGFDFTSFSNCLINLSKLRERFFSFGEKQITEKLCSIAYYTGESLKKMCASILNLFIQKKPVKGLRDQMILRRFWMHFYILGFLDGTWKIKIMW